MHVRLSIGIAVLGLLAAAVPAPAHHAFAAEFDVEKPITLRGTVTIMEWVNPHSWIHIDVKGADGTLVNWMVEGGSPNSLLRLGFTKNALLPGMEILVEGYQAKDGSNKGVGRSLTFADGRKLFLSETVPGGRGE
ncbi:MAG: hypothetical protein AUJ01_11075 [Acidobacteria bacterium 13_1_40CM_3_65_5]|nr:MAG: hypothetical protein AUJ01_11075 [Acidobacteria bacterium 13_1_40CM_3_65_5]OLE80154.1 MAG: hypothetical protein AUF76_15190 [Acidobacteria bacterium 13_1_20CM_2_65_9]